MTSQRRRVALTAWLVWAVAAAAGAAAQPLPELRGPVNDFAGVIDPGSAAEIDRLSRALQSRTGDAIVVVTVNSVEPYANAREYAVKMFENRGRGIGARGSDNGVLVLLAVTERRVEIEVGYGLEPYITDGFAGETARLEMAPHFRQGAFGAGLLAGVARLAGRIAEARGVELETKGGRPAARPAAPPQNIGGVSFLALLLLFAVVRGLLSAAFGSRRRRSRWGRRRTWSGWHSGVGPFGGGFGMGGGFGGFGGGGGGGGFGGFGGGRSGGAGGGASW